MNFIDIIIFATISAFLGYRLHQMLGRRHGKENQRPNPFTRNPSKPDDISSTRPQSKEAETQDEAYTNIWIPKCDQIKTLDPSFNEHHFIEGARIAFQVIVDAFTQGDTETLKPLLSEEIYNNFYDTIRERTKTGERHETTIHTITMIEVIETEIHNSTVDLTMSFTSEQTNVVFDNHDRRIGGDPEHRETITDIWTFSRDTRTKNPNWILIETRVPA